MLDDLDFEGMDGEIRLTFDMLRMAHRSIPGNPLLAESLYLAEYIERMGTGTLDMIRRCAAAGLPEPEFSVADGFVTIVSRQDRGVISKSGLSAHGATTGATQETSMPAQKTREKTGKTREKTREETREKTGKTREKTGKTREKTREKILAMIAADPSITTAKLAKQIGITPKGIEWQIGELRRMGILERIGPAKGGHWKVVETGDD